DGPEPLQEFSRLLPAGCLRGGTRSPRTVGIAAQHDTATSSFRPSHLVTVNWAARSLFGSKRLRGKTISLEEGGSRIIEADAREISGKARFQQDPGTGARERARSRGPPHVRRAEARSYTPSL